MTKWSILSLATNNSLKFVLAAVIFAASMLIFYGCNEPGKYFNRNSVSDFDGQADDLARLLSSARKSTYLINTVSYYTQYFFPQTQTWKMNDLKGVDFKSQDWETNVITKPASGTGILLGWHRKNIVFLSSAHLFDLSDTIFVPIGKKETDRYSSVLIRTKHEIFLPDIFTDGNLEILARDIKSDICLVSGKVNPDNRKLHVFPFPLGNSKALDWGSEVYIIGFPQGFHMVTRGLVSKPFKLRPYEFAIDAPFNHGMSGAPILNFNPVKNSLQLVGIGKSVSATTVQILSPELAGNSDSTLVRSIYKGAVYTDEITLVNQGVSFTVPTNLIRKFLIDNNEPVKDMGISLKYLLGNQ